jgi:hypothetical protein
MHYLLEEACRQQTDKERLKAYKVLCKSILDQHIFNPELYRAIKGTVRPKSLNIGLKFWLAIVKSLKSRESSQKNRETVLMWLLSENFMTVFIKNLYALKNALHEISLDVKQALLDLVSAHKLSSELALELVVVLFGPNP